MKKICMLILPLLMAGSVLAQPVKNDFMMSFDASYYKIKSTESILQGEDKTKEKSLGLSFSVERLLTDRFAVGLGLARYWDDFEETVMSDLGNEVSMTYGETESNYWMPRIFCKYYFPVAGRFYIVPHLIGSYGKANVDGSVFMATEQRLPSDELVLVDASNTNAFSYGIRMEEKLLTIEAAPEFVYFFAKHWGVSVYLGGLRYDRASGDLDDSEWTFSFKRKYWRLGVNFNF